MPAGLWGPLAELLEELVRAMTKLAGVALGWILGRTRELRRAAERASEVKDEQLEIAARPPADRDELLDRMRRNGL